VFGGSTPRYFKVADRSGVWWLIAFDSICVGVNDSFVP